MYVCMCAVSLSGHGQALRGQGFPSKRVPQSASECLCALLMPVNSTPGMFQHERRLVTSISHVPDTQRLDNVIAYQPPSHRRQNEMSLGQRHLHPRSLSRKRALVPSRAFGLPLARRRRKSSNNLSCVVCGGTVCVKFLIFLSLIFHRFAGCLLSFLYLEFYRLHFPLA